MPQPRTVTLKEALARTLSDHRAGRLDRARQGATALADRFPDRSECWLAVARCALPDQGDVVSRAARRALVLDPRTVDGPLLLCHLHEERDPARARRHGRHGLCLSPGSLRANSVAAMVAHRTVALGSTIPIARRPALLAPEQPHGWSILGDAHLGDGDPAAAARSYRRALTIAPAAPDLLYAVSTVTPSALPTAEVARTIAAAEDGRLSGEALEFAGFALGAYFDSRDDPCAALRWYVAANAAHRGRHPSGVEPMSRFLDRSRAVAWPDAGPPPACNRTPIFIVGLPGSGTTLVESVLSMHSAVTPAGELGVLGAVADRIAAYPAGAAALKDGEAAELAGAYLDAVDAAVRPATPFFTDKMPTNFIHLGLIRRLFPQAPILHARRHPMATAWSLFRRRFTTGHDYAYALEDIAEFIDIERQFMAHWRARWPAAIHAVDYEDLLADTEPALRVLVQHAGLNWEPACLDFHRAERRVSTASTLAVRRPLDRRAGDRWRRYAEFLAPVRRRLGIAE